MRLQLHIDLDVCLLEAVVFPGYYISTLANVHKRAWFEHGLSIWYAKFQLVLFMVIGDQVDSDDIRPSSTSAFAELSLHLGGILRIHHEI